MPPSNTDSADYLAKPPGDCCLKGTIHDGEPRGRVETIADIDTYVVKPPSGKDRGAILLFFPDVWGLFKNGNLVMDGFADAGYTVFGLDYFQGVSPAASMCINLTWFLKDPVWKYFKSGDDPLLQPGFDFQSWKAKHKAFADEHVPGWIEKVKDSYGKPGTKYAAVG